MRVLNLYSGIGGNRKLWKDVEVTAVEKSEAIAEVYSQNFPDDQVVIGDAHDYLKNNYDKYDFIWSSPPCQSHSRMVLSGRNRTPDYFGVELYQEIIFLQTYHKGLWCVENVIPYYQPLIEPKKLGRHAFWSNFNIGFFDIPRPPDFINKQNLEAKKQIMEWLGIHFDQNIYYEGNHDPCQVLRNAVHPELGEYVMNCALGVKKQAKDQIDMF